MTKKLISMVLVAALLIAALPAQALAAQWHQPENAFFSMAELTEIFSAFGEAPQAASAALSAAPEPAVAALGNLGDPVCNVEDFTYDTLGDGTLRIKSYIGEDINVRIPEEINGIAVTCIGDSAFYYCKSLAAVTIPDSVTSIEGYAFAFLSSLTSVTIPDSVTAIGSHAFYDCESLTDVTIPDSVTSIDTGAFSDCTSLTNVTIPDSVTSISEAAFAGCTSLTNVTIPDSVTTIGICAFSDCTSLTDVTIPDSVTSIGDYAFAFCESLTDVTIPDSVTIIGRYPFWKCSGLTSVTIPDSVTSIGDGMFSDCTSLTSVTIPNSVTEIGGSAFSGCTGLASVTIPDSVTYIGGGTFSGCSRLTDVTIPDSVTSIGDEAFSKCTSLTSVTIPDSVTSIDDYAFAYCESLTGVTIPDSVTFIGDYTFAYCESLTGVTIPGSVTSIGDYVFFDCYSLTDVTILDGITSIGDEMFYHCENLTSVTIPGSVTSIGDYAFSYCYSLTDLYIPVSVTTLGEDVFFDAESLTIHAHLDSYAALYAADYGIPLILEYTADDEASLYLDRTATRFQAAVNGLSASGNLSFVAEYAFKENAAPADMVVEFFIPDHLDVVWDTLTLDGSSDFAYEYQSSADRDYRNALLSIPVTRRSGTIRFQLKPLSYDNVAIAATMEFAVDGVQKREILGAVYEELPILSLNTANQANTREVTVSGVTVPGNEVTLYVDGVQQTVVTANKVGDYSAVVSLGEIASGQRRTVTAETDGGNGRITAEKVVVYRPDEPVLESVTFRHSSTQEFTGNSGASGARYPMTFVPGRGMEFSVKFDAPERIDTVYVVSTRGREEKIIVCNYDEATDTFTGTGNFDASNPNYVPGDFTVEYIPKAEPLDYTNGFDYTSQEKFNELPESWQNAEVTVVENSGTTTDLSFKIPEANGSETTFRAVSKTAPIPSNLTQENVTQQGYIPTTDAKGKQAFARVYEKDGGLVTEMVDFAAGNIVQSVIEKVISGGKEISGKVFALKAVSMYSNLGASMDDYHEIWKDIYYSDLSTDEQAALMGDLGVAVLAHAGLSMLQAVALVGFYAVGIAASSFALPAMAALGVVSFTIGLFQGNIKSWMGRKMYAKQTEFALRTKWYIDPSGYVYDNQTQEVIPGATVTVHWIPYDGTDASYWSEKPGADVYGEVWDASEYSQFNPLKTDDFGHYAWDVPEGWWRVKCEKEGYETVWSDWLPVPPPQTEVHLGMTPLAVAAVPGDINGDGKRNNRDVTRLMQYLAGWDVQVVEARLDINGDGKHNNRDVTRLMQYLAGWNVEIY